MEQNGEIGQGENNQIEDTDPTAMFEKEAVIELAKHKRFELKLFYIEIIILIILIILSALREVYFPSDVGWIKWLRNMIK